MSCRFVLISEGRCIENSRNVTTGLEVVLSKQLCDGVQLFIRIDTFDEYDSVIQITSFNQAFIGKLLDFAQENEGPGASDFVFEFRNLVHTRMLGAENRAAVIHHDRNPEFILWLGYSEHLNTFFLVFVPDI